MNQRSFWTYLLWSLGITTAIFAVTTLISACAASNPAYDQHAQHVTERQLVEAAKDRWVLQEPQLREVRKDYHHFEEYLAGARSIEDLPSNYQHRARVLKESFAGRSEEYFWWLQEVARVQAAPFDKADMFKLSSLEERGDSSRSARDIAEIFIKDPVRSAKLFRGDLSVIPSIESDPLPDGFRVLDTPLPPAPPRMTWSPSMALGRLSWMWQWFVCAGAFATLFTLFGYGFYTEGQTKWSHPLLSFPGSIISWILMLAMAPGFLALHVVRLMNLNLREQWRAWQRKRRLHGENFDEEYAAALAQLQDLRAEVEGTGSDLDIKQIDAAMQSVKDSRSAEHMRRISDAVHSLKTGIGDRHDAMHEINAYLEPEGSPSVSSAS